MQRLSVVLSWSADSAERLSFKHFPLVAQRILQAYKRNFKFAIKLVAASQRFT